MADDEPLLLEADKGKTFKDLIKNKFEMWRKQYDDDNRYRVAEYVTMVRRDRGDHFGNFDEEWLDKKHPMQYTWKPMSSKGFVTYPVIRRSINAKIATELSTDIRLSVEPVRVAPNTEAVAKMCDKALAYGLRTIWDPRFDYKQCKMRQLGRLAYVLMSADKKGGIDMPIPNMVPKPSITGSHTYDCQTCGNQITPEEIGAPNIIETAQQNLDQVFDAHSAAKQEDPDSPTPDFQEHYQNAIAPETITEAAPGVGETYHCPICAESDPTPQPLVPQIQDMDMQMVPAHDGTFSYRKTGCVNGTLISALNTRIDEFNAVGFEMEKAHWFCYRFLLPTYEVELMCDGDPDAIRGVKAHTSSMWSDSVRWSYELLKNRGNVTPDYGENSLSHLTECEMWWVRPIACQGWKASGDERIGKWSIKYDQTIAESFTSQKKNGKPTEFEGLCALVVGHEPIRILNEDFREKWFGIAWTPDPHSYFPQGEERLLPLQDAATRIFTLVYSFTQRSTTPRTVANDMYFTREDLEAHVVGGIIKTKHSMKTPERVDLTKHIFNLEAGELPETIMKFIELLIQVVKEETGIYDATVGQGDDSNKTKGGRELAMNRSLGLQLPETQAKGVGLVEFAYRYFPLVAQMDDSFFTLLIDEDEEEFTEEDIKNFRACNFRDEINVSVTEGTDVPRTRGELEEAYSIAIELGLFDPASPMPVDVRSQMLKMRGINYDLEEYDANQRVANKRYEAIRERLLSENPGNAIIMQPIPDPADPTGMTPMMDASGVPMLEPALDPMILQDLMQNPDTQPQQFADNHLFFITFYKKKLYGVLTSRPINAVLVLGINACIQASRGFAAAEMATQQSLVAGAGGDPNAEDGGSDEKGKPKEKKPSGPPK